MIGHVAATAGLRLVLTALALVSSILTARYLGQAGRGDYFFMVTLASVLVQATSLGLTQSNTWLVARDPSSRPALIGNSLWVSLVVTGGAGASVAVGAQLLGMLQDTPASYLWLAAALAPASVFYMLGTHLLVGVGRIRTFNVAEAGSRVLVFGAFVAAGIAGVGAGGFVGAAIVTWTISAAGVGIAVSRGVRIPWRFDREMFRRGLRFALKAYAVTLLAFLVLRGNVFLLRREWGPAELGLYSIAAQVSDVLFILPQTVSLILFPVLVRAAATRWATTIRVAAVVAATLTVVALVTAAVAEPAIGLLFGDEYRPAARVLYVMLPGVVFVGVAGVFGQYLGAIGMPGSYVLVWAGSFAVLICSSLVLVPDRAGAGAAAALSGTYALYLAATFLLALHYHRLRRDEPVGNPLPTDIEDRTPVGE